MTWQDTLEATAHAVADHRGKGKVADYIPALAQMDPQRFAMATVSCGGERAAVGDTEACFSIQSIVKVFILTAILTRIGDRLWERVWREPSGTRFNSLVQLESDAGRPRNPFINPGALVMTDCLMTEVGQEAAVETVLALIHRVTENPAIAIDEDIARSEAESDHRNAGLAHILTEYGNLENEVEAVLEVYTRLCAVSMTARDLARSGLYLAAHGRDPITDAEIVPPLIARRINALMLTCGHYDAAGDFAFRVGLPGKSGVGGGILAVAPGRLSIGTWSPGLNANGNSYVGTLALEALAARSNLAVL